MVMDQQIGEEIVEMGIVEIMLRRVQPHQTDKPDQTTGNPHLHQTDHHLTDNLRLHPTDHQAGNLHQHQTDQLRQHQTDQLHQHQIDHRQVHLEEEVALWVEAMVEEAEAVEVAEEDASLDNSE
jgi:hypothetical protein